MSARTTRPTRPLVRLAAVTGAAGVLTLGAAGVASAHVSVTPSGTAAGSYVVLTFSVPHGCDGSPTTKLDIQVPEGINTVTATRNPYYDLDTTIDQVDPPITGPHGDEITERTSVVTYTATTPLPDGQRDTLELSVQLPEDAEGETLAFPVIQTCEKGQTAWTQVATGDQTEDDLEDPAPTVAVTAAGEGGHHDDATGDDAAEGDAAPVSDTESADTTQAASVTDDGGSNGLAVAGLAAGVVGILVGGLALARSRRTA